MQLRCFFGYGLDWAVLKYEKKKEYDLEMLYMYIWKRSIKVQIIMYGGPEIKENMNEY